MLMASKHTARSYSRPRFDDIHPRAPYSPFLQTLVRVTVRTVMTTMMMAADSFWV